MMNTEIASEVIGRGTPAADLVRSELRDIVAQALSGIAPRSRVLAIVPDKTRDDNTDTLFPIAAEILAGRGVSVFDALIAQGTHAPMTYAEKRHKIGAPFNETNTYGGRIHDHHWDDVTEIATLGELPAAQVARLTRGAFDRAIPITINRHVVNGEYDTILVFSATVPHEVAGYAGGAKYFFPGVAGPHMTHATHWVGALATVEKTIGRVETPVRHLIEAAADLIPTRIITFNSVVTRAGGESPNNNDQRLLRTHALFAGDYRLAFRRAAEVSRTVHIKYTHRTYARVVALLDEHYDEMWVGGKASYKLGGIIEAGGELIIYAPHMRHLSLTHGRLIEKYGYAPLETIRAQLADAPDLRDNLCVAAHLTHVAYGSRNDSSGNILPRYRITLASQIDAATCRRVHLGYLNHRNFDVATYASDPDTLIVPHAGRDLYLAEPQTN